MPQLSDPNAPAANRLPPRIKVRAVHTPFRKKDLYLVDNFFIVKYYTNTTMYCQPKILLNG
jgi:hypothetical protein